MSMALRLTTAEAEALCEVARREHRSMQAVAREAIFAYVTNRTRRRHDQLAAIVEDAAGRLAQWRIDLG